MDLSKRQQEVLALAARGLCDREMGAELELSPQTVRHTLKAARRKLSARNTTHAVAIALTYHLIVMEGYYDVENHVDLTGRAGTHAVIRRAPGRRRAPAPASA